MGRTGKWVTLGGRSVKATMLCVRKDMLCTLKGDFKGTL